VGSQSFLVTRHATRRRLQPEVRRDQILVAAIELITAQGLDFSTRDLARRLSISHPLLFRYFDSKEAILEAVYDEVFIGRYTNELQTILNENATDQIEKWTRFYVAYFPRIYDETWIRIFVASAFNNQMISQRYLRNVVEPLIESLAKDTERHVLGRTSSDRKLRKLSRELAWALHSSMFYTGVRRWIFLLSVPEEVASYVPDKVRAHFTGARSVLDLT
jgi:AcrR family transcriptional regulator